MLKWNPDETQSFTAKEMACKCGKCSGQVNMDSEFMHKLQRLRDLVGRPLTITSGYRCHLHPEEVKKGAPGAHSAGLAADISTGSAKERYQIIAAALNVGMVGIGVANSFIHVDGGHPQADLRPAVWKY